MRMIDADKVIELITEVQKDYPITDRREIARAMRVALFDIRRMIENQPTINRWIPVRERLPQDNSDVLVCAEDGQILIGWLDGANDWWICSEVADDFKSVIAWMPLPSPFKESEE